MKRKRERISAKSISDVPTYTGPGNSDRYVANIFFALLILSVSYFVIINFDDISTTGGAFEALSGNNINIELNPVEDTYQVGEEVSFTSESSLVSSSISVIISISEFAKPIIIDEGETIPIIIDGTEYELTLVDLLPNKAYFTFDGSPASLDLYKAYGFGNGISIVLSDTLYQSFSSGEKSAYFVIRKNYVDHHLKNGVPMSISGVSSEYDIVATLRDWNAQFTINDVDFGTHNIGTIFELENGNKLSFLGLSASYLPSSGSGGGGGGGGVFPTPEESDEEMQVQDKKINPSSLDFYSSPNLFNRDFSYGGTNSITNRNQELAEVRKFYGYIVEFNDPATLEIPVQVDRLSAAGVDHDSYHDQAKADIASRLSPSSYELGVQSGPQLNVMREFYHAFNGILLEVNPSQAEIIENSPYVKAVYPNYEVQANLDISASAIKATDVWLKNKQATLCGAHSENNPISKDEEFYIGNVLVEYTGSDSLDKSSPQIEFKINGNTISRFAQNTADKYIASINYGSSNYKVYWASDPFVDDYDIYVDFNQNDMIESGSGECINGTGVTIGILDTGIDYLHDDLGATKKVSNEFTVVNPNDRNENPWSFKSFSMSGSKLAYGVVEGFNIYDTATGQTQTFRAGVELPEEIDGVSTIGFKDDVIVFIGPNQNFDFYLYYYDLSTNTATRISDVLYSYAGVDTDGRYITFSIDGSSYSYDTQTNERTLLDITYSPILQTEDGRAVYSSFEVGESCYSGLVIFDLKTGTKEEIYPPDLGGVIDFKGNEILYYPCIPGQDLSFSTVYVYNIDTQEHFKVEYDPAQLGSEDIESQGTSMVSTGWISKASISDDVIFFTTDLAAQKFVAYDRNTGVFVTINPFTNSNHIDSNGNTVCFMGDGTIYCHEYDPNFEYPKPQKYNSKVIGGWNFVADSDDIYDDHYHGTHVAATAAGNGFLKGIAPDATLYGFKVLNGAGFGTTADIIAAIERSIDPNQDGDFSDKIDIISLSLGGSGNPDDSSSKAIDAMHDLGIVAVISAGNSGPDPYTIGSPGTARNAITVAASDNNGDITDFSSRGPVTWQNSISSLLKPSITAPGYGICAAKATSVGGTTNSDCLDTDHIALSGTSMAAPHVSGVVALILDANPNYNPNQVRNAIMSTAELKFPLNAYGSGVIDAQKAVMYDASVYAKSNAIQFGIIDSSEDIATATKTITLYNTNDFDVTIRPSVSPGTEYISAIMEESYIIPANSQLDIDITIQVDVVKETEVFPGLSIDFVSNINHVRVLAEVILIKPEVIFDKEYNNNLVTGVISSPIELSSITAQVSGPQGWSFEFEPKRISASIYSFSLDVPIEGEYELITISQSVSGSKFKTRDFFTADLTRPKIVIDSIQGTDQLTISFRSDESIESFNSINDITKGSNQYSYAGSSFVSSSNNVYHTYNEYIPDKVIGNKFYQYVDSVLINYQNKDVWQEPILVSRVDEMLDHFDNRDGLGDYVVPLNPSFSSNDPDYVTWNYVTSHRYCGSSAIVAKELNSIYEPVGEIMELYSVSACEQAVDYCASADDNFGNILDACTKDLETGELKDAYYVEHSFVFNQGDKFYLFWIEEGGKKSSVLDTNGANKKMNTNRLYSSIIDTSGNVIRPKTLLDENSNRTENLLIERENNMIHIFWDEIKRIPGNYFSDDLITKTKYASFNLVSDQLSSPIVLDDVYAVTGIEPMDGKIFFTDYDTFNDRQVLKLFDPTTNSISQISSYDAYNYNTNLELDPSGKLHIIYRDIYNYVGVGTGLGIYHMTYDTNTKTFSEPICNACENPEFFRYDIGDTISDLNGNIHSFRSRLEALGLFDVSDIGVFDWTIRNTPYVELTTNEPIGIPIRKSSDSYSFVVDAPNTLEITAYDKAQNRNRIFLDCDANGNCDSVEEASSDAMRPESYIENPTPNTIDGTLLLQVQEKSNFGWEPVDNIYEDRVSIGPNGAIDIGSLWDEFGGFTTSKIGQFRALVKFDSIDYGSYFDTYEFIVSDFVDVSNEGLQVDNAFAGYETSIIGFYEIDGSQDLENLEATLRIIDSNNDETKYVQTIDKATANSWRAAFFKHTPQISGDYDIIFSVHHDFDQFPFNNVQSDKMKVSNPAPDLDVYLSRIEGAIVNNEISIPVSIYNQGVGAATDIIANIYLINKPVSMHLFQSHGSNHDIDGTIYNFELTNILHPTGSLSDQSTFELTISYNGKSEVHSFTNKNLYASLDNGLGIVVTDIELDYIRFYIGDVSLDQKELEDIAADDLLETKLGIVADKVGKYAAVVLVIPQNDISFSNNYDYRTLIVSPLGPNIEAEIISNLLESDLDAGEPATLYVNVSNVGTLPAQNILVSAKLLDYNNYFEEVGENNEQAYDDYKLAARIGAQEIDVLEAGSYKTLAFDWTPKLPGEFRYFVFAESKGDVNRENNQDSFYINVMGTSGDARAFVYPSYELRKNEPATIDYNVYNPTDFSMGQVNVTIYAQYSNIVEEIISQKINQLSNYDYFSDSVSYIPKNSGLVEFIIVANVTQDFNSENNVHRAKREVASNEPDVRIELLPPRIPLTEGYSELRFTIIDSSSGLSKGFNATSWINGAVNRVNYYQNQFFNYVWYHPLEDLATGVVNIEGKVNASNDPNLANNYVSKELNVYEKIQIEFSAIDSQGNLADNIWEIYDSEIQESSFSSIFPNIPTNVTVATIIPPKADSVVTNPEIHYIVFNDLVLKEPEMKFIKELYVEEKSADMNRLALVYAVDPNSTFTSSTYLSYVPMQSIETRVDETRLVGCRSWNFTSASCDSKWVKIPATRNYDTGYYTSISSPGLFTAFGIAEKDYDGDNTPDWEDSDSDNDGVDDDSDNFVCGIQGVESNTYSKINISVDDKKDDFENTLSGTKKIILGEGENTVVEFDVDFDSSKLDCSPVTVEKQTEDSSLGYVIVSGLREDKTKTIYVDIVAGRNQVCVKDQEVSSISELSADCTGENEILIDCNGLDINGYTCSIVGDEYKVTGLKHSAVTEPSSCVENWDCSDWSVCSEGLQTRSCTDLNSCGTEFNKPAEGQSCTVPTAPAPSSPSSGAGGAPGGGAPNSGSNAGATTYFELGDVTSKSLTRFTLSEDRIGRFHFENVRYEIKVTDISSNSVIIETNFYSTELTFIEGSSFEFDIGGDFVKDIKLRVTDISNNQVKFELTILDHNSVDQTVEETDSNTVDDTVDFATKPPIIDPEIDGDVDKPDSFNFIPLILVSIMMVLMIGLITVVLIHIVNNQNKRRPPTGGAGQGMVNSTSSSSTNQTVNSPSNTRSSRETVLDNYVSSKLKAGQTTGQITQNLTNAGWPEDLVNDSFRRVLIQ